MLKLLVVLLFLGFAKATPTECSEDHCNLVDCAEPTPENCMEKLLAYVPRDPKICHCCATCQKTNDVTRRITCKPDECDAVRCAPEKIEDCKPNEVLVPYGQCYCCPSCVEKCVGCT